MPYPPAAGTPRPVLETVAVQKLLNEELARRKAANPAYSLRSLARQLKVSPAALSLLLNGRRPASKNLAKQVSKSLGLDPQQEADLLALYELKKAKSTPRQSAELRLRADQFHLVADWHCFAILSLLETAGAKSKASWIAQRLGLTTAATEAALERMVRLGLLKVSSKGSYQLTNTSFTTSDEIASSAIKKNHTQMLELAKVSLERDPLELRDLLSITMAIDPAKIPEAKVLMRDFREKLSNFLSSGKKTEVYALALQLIPLSRK